MSTTMLACGGHQRLEFCEFPKVLGDCCEGKFILDAVWAAQSEPGQAKDAFKVGEEHLDFLSSVRGGLIEV